MSSGSSSSSSSSSAAETTDVVSSDATSWVVGLLIVSIVVCLTFDFSGNGTGCVGLAGGTY